MVGEPRADSGGTRRARPELDIFVVWVLLNFVVRVWIPQTGYFFMFGSYLVFDLGFISGFCLGSFITKWITTSSGFRLVFLFGFSLFFLFWVSFSFFIGVHLSQSG